MTFLAAITAPWDDIYAAGGFITGLLGLFVGVLGFAYTIVQIKKTKSAAMAAQEAANQMLQESRRRFQKFVATTISRLLADAKRFVSDENWTIASYVTDQVADFLALSSDADADIPDMVQALRKYGQQMAARIKDSEAPFHSRKWSEIVQRVQVKIDQWHAPFNQMEDS